MEYRIKKYKKGWIVEYKKPIWGLFGLKYRWVHITHYMGLKDCPFYYETPERAREGAIREIKDKITFSFRYNN